MRNKLSIILLIKLLTNFQQKIFCNRSGIFLNPPQFECHSQVFQSCIEEDNDAVIVMHQPEKKQDDIFKSCIEMQPQFNEVDHENKESFFSSCGKRLSEWDLQKIINQKLVLPQLKKQILKEKDNFVTNTSTEQYAINSKNEICSKIVNKNKFDALNKGSLTEILIASFAPGLSKPILSNILNIFSKFGYNIDHEIATSLGINLAGEGGVVDKILEYVLKKAEDMSYHQLTNTISYKEYKTLKSEALFSNTKENLQQKIEHMNDTDVKNYFIDSIKESISIFIHNQKKIAIEGLKDKIFQDKGLFEPDSLMNFLDISYIPKKITSFAARKLFNFAGKKLFSSIENPIIDKTPIGLTSQEIHNFNYIETSNEKIGQDDEETEIIQLKSVDVFKEFTKKMAVNLPSKVAESVINTTYKGLIGPNGKSNYTTQTLACAGNMIKATGNTLNNVSSKAFFKIKGFFNKQ